MNQQLQQQAQQLKSSLDQIVQAKNDPNKVQQMVEQAKQHVDRIVQQAQQGD